MHHPIVSLLCDSATNTASSRGVSRLRLALLVLLLLLQLQPRPVEGQSRRQQELLCTIEPRPVLVGLASSSPEDDLFGYDTSLAQDGTIAAIGAPRYGSNLGGYVLVFRFENNTWMQLGSTISGDTPSTWTSANALSDDGSIIAVGGWYTRNVRVFRLVDDDWEQIGNNITISSGVYIGFALAISGDGTILAASSPYTNSGAGEVLVVELVENVWSQKGSSLQGQGEEQLFGWSVSLSQDGSRVAVGIPGFYNGETNGSVRVYEFIDDWVQIGQTHQGTNVGDNFGNDVSLSSDGKSLAVGAANFDGNSDSLGSVHVYRFGSNGQWLEPGSMLIGKSAKEQFGRSLALSGDASILVASGSGRLRFFEADGNEWIEVGEEATNSTSNNYAAISRDGSTAMGGANVFDVSCLPEKTPDTATASSVPSPAPFEAPMKSPIAVPVLSPSPTGITGPPDDNPTLLSLTTAPAVEKTSPTRAPRTNVTAGTMVQETFPDVSLSFIGVSTMGGPETKTFELLTKEWYEMFFVERSGRVLQSLMLDARDMQTTIEVTEQNVSASEDGSALINKITYKQTIAYTAESNNVDANNYITLPFKDVDAITEYGKTLKFELDAFQDLQSPLPIPQIESDIDAGGDGNDGEGNAIGVIVGASIGGAVFLAVAVFVGNRVSMRKEDVGESVRAVQQSNNPVVESQEQTSAQQSSSPVESQGQRVASAEGVFVYDGEGEALTSRTEAAQAVLLSSDNPTTLQELLPKFKDQVRPS